MKDSKANFNIDIDGIIKNKNTDIKRHALGYRQRVANLATTSYGAGGMMGSEAALAPATTRNRKPAVSLVDGGTTSAQTTDASARLNTLQLSNLIDTPPATTRNHFGHIKRSDNNFTNNNNATLRALAKTSSDFPNI